MSRKMPPKRSWTRALVVLVLCLAGLDALSSHAYAQARLETVLTNLSSPLFATHAGDARLFIVERAGRVRIYDTNTRSLLATPFLDIVSKVGTGGERGLFSIAFHPDFAQNRHFFVNYTNLQGNTVIERYQVSSTNPNLADLSSARQLLTVTQPFDNHNGGQLQIGPQDGYLYIGMGDGGSAGDPSCYAQRNDSLLGKMLRLDVRANLNVAPYYGIPNDNPFRSPQDPGNLIPDEVWAFGLRNPWRFSFDRATGDLYIADVGQNAWEEIDRHRAGTAGGQNFGWKPMEGRHCFSSTGCPTGTPACNSPSLTLPIFEYSHDVGCSITGGYVARGPRTPPLSGKYIYSDYCEGTIWALQETSPGVFQNTQVLDTTDMIVSFGEGSTGRLFVLGLSTLYELVWEVPPVPALPSWVLVTLLLGLLIVGVALLKRFAPIEMSSKPDFRLNVGHAARVRPTPRRRPQAAPEAS